MGQDRPDRLSRIVLKDAQLVRPEIKWKDVQEWNIGEIKPQDDTEETFKTPNGFYVTIKKKVEKK